MAAFDALNAIIKAQENVSDALEEIAGAAEATSHAIDGLNRAFEKLDDSVLGSDVALEELEDVTIKVDVSVENLESSIGDISQQMRGLIAGTMTTNRHLESLANTFHETSAAGQGVNVVMQNAQGGILQVGESAMFTAEQAERLSTELHETGLAANSGSVAMSVLANKLFTAAERGGVATVSMETLEEAIDELSQHGAVATPIIKLLQGRVDELGDEAKKSSAEIAGLSAAMKALSLDSLAMSADIGFINVGLRNLLTTIPALIITLGALTDVFMGLAVATGAVTVGFAGMLGGGLLALAESIRDANPEVETLADALEKIGHALKVMFIDALEPLRNGDNVEFFYTIMEGLAKVVYLVSASIERMRGVMMNFADEVGEGFWENFPRLIAAVEYSLTELLPILADLFVFLAQYIPRAFQKWTNVTVKLADELDIFGKVLLDMMGTLIDFGTTLFEVLLPALSAFFYVLTRLVDAFNALPTGMQKAIIAMLLTSVVLLKLRAGFANLGFSIIASKGALLGYTAALNGTAISANIAALATKKFWTSLLGPVGIAIALVSVLVGIITYFGLWDDIIGSLVTGWNTLVAIIETAINTIIGITNKLGIFGDIVLLLMGPLGMFILAFKHMDAIMAVVDAGIAAIGATIQRYLVAPIERLLDLIGVARKKAKEAAGSDAIDLSGAKIKQGVGKQANAGDTPDVRRRTTQVTNIQNNYSADLDIDATSDANSSQIKRMVQDALFEAEEDWRRRSGHPGG